MLGDRDHGHERSRVAADHLRAMVGDREQDPRHPIIQVRLQPRIQCVGPLGDGFREVFSVKCFSTEHVRMGKIGIGQNFTDRHRQGKLVVGHRGITPRVLGGTTGLPR